MADAGRVLLPVHPLFCELDGGVPASLLAGLEPVGYADGAWLFREGAQARYCLLMIHGRVEVLRMGSDGEERVYSLFGRGQLVAEAAMFMAHGRYPMSARAQGKVVVARLERQTLRDACLSQPSLAMRMLDWLGGRIYQRTNEVDWLIGSTAPQRFAAYLLSLQHDGGAQPRVVIPLSRQQLAGSLGLRPETLSRLLSEWQRQGYLEGRGREWELHDPAFFRALASGARRPF